MRMQSFSSVVERKNHREKNVTGFPGKTQFNCIDVEREKIFKFIRLKDFSLAPNIVLLWFVLRLFFHIIEVFFIQLSD